MPRHSALQIPVQILPNAVQVDLGSSCYKRISGYVRFRISEKAVAKSKHLQRI